MSDILIAVPVLSRPERALHIARSAMVTKIDYRLLFLCSPGDDVELEACLEAVAQTEHAEAVVVPFDQAPGDFQRKINYSFTISSEPWVFAGADDLVFHPDWDVIALSVASSTRKRFIGTNDQGNVWVMRGKHSTHSLVARSYVMEHGTIDEPEKLYHEGYSHNWCDNEAVETAMNRREFVFARRSVVEHLHPMNEKAEMDATYELGLADFVPDRELFIRRRKLIGPVRGQHFRRGR